MKAMTTRYSRLIIVIHWSTAVVLLLAYLLSEGGPGVRTDPPRWHCICGTTVLLLVIPRVVARALGNAPPLHDSVGKWLITAAKLVHTTLYLLLIAVPVTGWYAMSRLGVTLKVFEHSLPALTAPVAGWPGAVAEIHQWGGNAVLIIAGLHAAPALWHHYVRHDNTLHRMNPL